MTILQALDGYYGRMAARGEAEAPGYSREKISFAIVISLDGDPVDIVDLRRASGRKLQPVVLEVPAAVKRTAGIAPNLFWDKTSYVLGRTAGEGRRTGEEHAAFKAAHLGLMEGAEDGGLAALRRFLERWTPERFDAPPFVPDMLDTNVVFALDGIGQYINARDAARRIAETRITGEGPTGVCLVTGMTGSTRRLHPTIKGVDGAQTAGAALVSFNLDAFTSYGKEQGANAPTSEAAAFRYGAALNRLLDRGAASRNRIKIGDATVAFWADVSGVGEEAAAAAEMVFAAMVEPPSDESEAAKIRDVLESIRSGRPAPTLDPALRPGTRFHVLGLAPNAARLSVRFWLTDSFEHFAERLARHYGDIVLEPAPWKRIPSVNFLLRKTVALQEKAENVPPLLAGEVMRAVLGGTRYPRTLLAAAIIRLRAGDDPGFGWHAAVIKAYVNRSLRTEIDHLRREGGDPAHSVVQQSAYLKERILPVALTKDHPSPAYQLGRLFSVLEAAQRAALGQVNASIADRYYGAASATPARVFGPLLRGLRVHVSDARKRGFGGWIEPKVAEIMSHLPPDLPKTLTLEDQGRFAVGYYHERGTRPGKDAEAALAAAAEEPAEEGDRE